MTHPKLIPTHNKHQRPMTKEPEDLDVERKREEEIRELPEIERKIKSYGTQSPSSEDLLRMVKLLTSMTFSDSQSQSRNQKSLINSSQTNLKNKSWKLNQSRNKPKPVKELDSKLSPLLVMDPHTLVSDGNVTNKSKVPLKELSLWPNLT